MIVKEVDMTRTQANTILALDASIVSVQNYLRQLDNVVKTKTPESDLVKNALKQADFSERLIIKLVETLK